ncbi:hypothetical protein ACOMHN_030262 [Nucella lapillus]
MAPSLIPLLLSSSLGLLLLFSPPVTGLEARGQSYDLQVETVSRALVREGGESKVVVTLTFTASIQPQTEWSRSGPNGETVYLNGTELTFSGGRGQARVTLARYEARAVFLDIGYLDTHYLTIFIRIRAPFNLTQTLNTVLSAISPGYDLIYDPGEGFQMNAFVPKHIAENFTWAHVMDDPEREYDVRLSSCYVDQTSGKVRSSVDTSHYSDMSKFLQYTRTYEENGARWQLDFTTAAEDISGYFRFFTLYQLDGYSWKSMEMSASLVTEIWEVVDVKVHNASTPGPFPDHYAYVGDSYRGSERCSKGRDCTLYCYGYGNNVTQATIYKEDTGESPGQLFADYENSNHVVFHIRFPTSGDYTGNYVCQVDTADGATAQSVITVQS